MISLAQREIVLDSANKKSRGQAPTSNTDVSRIEIENQRLKKEVKDLKSSANRVPDVQRTLELFMGLAINIYR